MRANRILITSVLVLGIVVIGTLLFTQLFDLGVRAPTSGRESVVSVGYRSDNDADRLNLPLAYEADWDEPGVSQALWKSWGHPRPKQVPELGRNGTGALNPNGDKNYHSGLVSRFLLDLRDGAVIEFWAKGATTTEHWQNIAVGLSAGLADDYYGVEQVPVALLNTFIGVEEATHFVEYRIGEEREQEPYAPLDDEWHNYRITIHPDGSVQFFRDGELKLAPETKIDMELYGQAPVVVDGLSWRTDVLLDELAIYGNIVVPEPLTIESQSPLLADGIVLRRPLSPNQGRLSRLGTGDLDGDGDIDAVYTARGTGNEIHVMENPGTLTAPWPTQQVSKLRSILFVLKLADFDGDGDLDIATGSGTEEDYEIKLWENDGTPFDGEWPVANVGKNAEEVASLLPIDVDDDGDLDLVSGTSYEVDAELLLYENTGDPHGAPWPQTELGATDDGIYEIHAADFDGDGDLDIATGGRRDDDFDINVWENDGTPFDGRWTDIKVGPSDGDVGAMQIADLDGDGFLDIVTGSTGHQDYEMQAWRNNGAPWENFWQEQDIGVTDVNATDLAVVDLDGDGARWRW